MGSSPNDQDDRDLGGGRRNRKVRLALRRNRSPRRRQGDLTRRAQDPDGLELDAARSESVTAKGDASRHRTVTIVESQSAESQGLCRGVVLAMRGLFADVDTGDRILSCTVRRMLRTRLIAERHPVTVGDRVLFRLQDETEGRSDEGVIEIVEPRTAILQRRTGRRVHTVVANVDLALIVSSADYPPPKPNLIDRYIVSSLAGKITPMLCMNKIDFDRGGLARSIAERYRSIGMEVLCTSTKTGEGVELLLAAVTGKSSVVVGQSGVGKSSLLNVIQPGLDLGVGDVSKDSRKGRHTTTTASLIRLAAGGYMVDTPGIRSFELSDVFRGDLEAYFVEIAEHVPNCKFPDCSHRHEAGCAVKAAVEAGLIHSDRYESYVKLFEEPEASMSR